MRRLQSSWTSTLARLGFRRRFRRKPNRDQVYMRRRPRLESLEPRQMLASDVYLVTTAFDSVNSTDGVTSLREALTLAATDGSITDNDIIRFDESLYYSGPATITLTYDGTDSGTVPDQLVVDSEVTIEGPGAELLAISGDNQTRPFWVQSGHTVAISGVSIVNGNSGTSRGGGIYNSGDLTLDHVMVSNNVSGEHAGGVYNNGTIRILNSTISDNTAVNSGGGLASNTNSELGVVIENSAIINNEAASGGAMYLHVYTVGTGGRSALITNSTVSGNSATGDAGGVKAVSGFSVTIVQSTITDNHANTGGLGGVGGGVYLSSSSLTLHNTIVADNTAASTYAEDVWANWGLNPVSSYNLIGSNGNSGLVNGTNGNIVGLYTAPISPKLTPLGDHGGTTKTHALFFDSPAVDKGSNAKALDANGNTIADDQRGSDRIIDSGPTGPSGGTVDIGAFELLIPSPLIVTTLADENDGWYGGEDLSLREALALAAYLPGTNTISFAPNLLTGGPATITLTYDGTDSGTDPDQFVVDSDVTIEGPGADLLSISGDNQNRAIWVQSGHTVDIRGLSIVDGNSGTASGGGIFNSGDLTLDGIVVSNNVAGDYGGGIYNNGTIHILNSTVSENVTSDNGGGLASNTNSELGVVIENSAIINNQADDYGAMFLHVYTVGTGGRSARITNSTISGNNATGDAGGVGAVSGFSVTIVQSTITDNHANTGGLGGKGGGLYVTNGSTTLHNTIVADNTAESTYAEDIFTNWGVNSASSHNLIGSNGNSGLVNNTNGNIVGLYTAPISPGLAQLGSYGGKTKTHALLDTSPAIDKGSNALALDAASNTLITDQRGLTRMIDHGVAGPSSGTVDIGALEWQKPLLQVDTLRDESDGNYGPGDLSLREALELAAVFSGNDVITFTPELFSAGPQILTLSFDGNDSGTSPDQLLIDSNVTIEGPGADLLSISGNDLTRLFQVSSGVTSTINGLRIAHGDSEAGNGGGIYNVGHLTLNSVTVEANAGHFGGGIYTGGTGSLTVNASRIQGNTSTADAGGGLYVSGGEIEISQTTIDRNIATHGAGMYLLEASSVNVVSSTFSRNEGSAIFTDDDFTGDQHYETSTVSNNTGDGFYFETSDAANSICILNCTIADNQGRGITIASGTAGIILQNSIVASNEGVSDVLGAFAMASECNVIGVVEGSTGLTADPNTHFGTTSAPFDPRIGALAPFGGMTETHPLLTDSQAIDAANALLAPAYDQRGQEQLDFDGAGAGGNVKDIGAYGLANYNESGAIIVTRNDDRYELNPVDGLSLREALRKAAEHPGPDTIVFSGDQFRESQRVLLDPQRGPLLITSDVTISGYGVGIITIDANGNEAVFSIVKSDWHSGTDIELDSLKLKGATGAAIEKDWHLTQDLSISDSEIVGNGGGIAWNYGEVSISNSHIGENSGGAGIVWYGGLRILDSDISSNGDGIHVQYGGIELIGSTIAGNSGTGIYASHALVTAVNSTISTNVSDRKAGGIELGTLGYANLTNVTITENRGNGSQIFDGDDAAGGIYADSASTVTMHNSIVAGNWSGPEVSALPIDLAQSSSPLGGIVSSSSHNLIGYVSEEDFSPDPGTENQIGTLDSPKAANLGPLLLHGGRTRTHALLSASEAIDAGDNSVAIASGITTDQRGKSRVVTSDASRLSGDYVDIGAFEVGLIVSNTGDAVDSNTSPGHLTLREALNLADALPGKNEIEFAGSLAGKTIKLTNGSLEIASSVELIGLGADATTVDANGAANVFQVTDNDVELSISRMNLRGATSSAVTNLGVATIAASVHIASVVVEDNGGGVTWANGDVTIVDSYINDNVGIGISAAYGSLEVSNSEVARNGSGVQIALGSATLLSSTIAANRGTGIIVSEAGLSASNTTISGNHTPFAAAGIILTSATADLANVTISGNRADEDNTLGNDSTGGIHFVANSSVSMHNSIVVGNFSGKGTSELSSDMAQSGFGNFYFSGSSYNILGETPSGWINDVTGAGNQTNKTVEQLKIAPLGFYGGSTRTHVLLPTSIAIDAGNNDMAVDAEGAPLLNDQNGAGFKRRLGANVDVGASEAHVILDGSDLFVYGTDLDDGINIGPAKVDINRIGTFEVDTSSVMDVIVHAGDGNDFVTIDPDPLFGVESTIYGGDGNDTLSGGSSDDQLYGGDGADTLYGGAGNDLLDGGSGNDQLFGQAGDDSLDGGAGNDQLDGGIGTDTIEGGDGQDQSNDDADDLIDDVGDNRAPIISWFGNSTQDLLETPTATMNVGDIFELHTYAYDLDGDELSYELQILNHNGLEVVDVTWRFFITYTGEIDPGNGTFYIQPYIVDYPDIEKFEVRVLVKESELENAQPTVVSFELTVVPTNAPPIIGSGHYNDDLTLGNNSASHRNTISVFGGVYKIKYNKLVGSGVANDRPKLKIAGFDASASYTVALNNEEDPDASVGGTDFSWKPDEGDYGKPHRIEITSTNTSGYSKRRTSIFYVELEMEEYYVDGGPHTTDHLIPGTIAKDAGTDIQVNGSYVLPFVDGTLADGTTPRMEWTNPSNGSVTQNSGGKYIFTPSEDFTGVSHFTYWWNNGEKRTTNEDVEYIKSNVGRGTIKIGPGIEFDVEFEEQASGSPPAANWLSSAGAQARTDPFSGNVHFGMPIGPGQFATYRPSPGPSIARVTYTANEEMHPEPGHFTYAIYADDMATPMQPQSINGQAVPAGSQGEFHISSAHLSARAYSGYRQVGVGGAPNQYFQGTFRFPVFRWIPDLRQDNFGFGDGWNLAGIERIVAPPDGQVGNYPIYWIRSDGYILQFDDFGVPAKGDENATVVYGSSETGYGLTDKFGNSTVFDAEGWIKERVDPYGKKTQYHYQDVNTEDEDDNTRNIDKITTDFDRKVIKFEYDPAYINTDTPLVQYITTYPDGMSEQFDEFRRTVIQYNGSLALSSISVPIDDTGTTFSVTSFAYDDEGRLSHYTDADVKSTQWEYSSDGDVVRTKYDGEGNPQTLLVRSKLADFSTIKDKVRYKQSNGGSLASRKSHFGSPAMPSQSRTGTFIDELGRTSSFKTDRAGYVVEEIDAAGRITRYTRNSVGQILSETLIEVTEQGETVLDRMVYTYDDRFNRTSIQYFDGTSEHWTYDPKQFEVTISEDVVLVDAPARVISYTDQLGRVTRYTYADYVHLSGAFRGEQNMTVRQIVGANDTTSVEHNDIVTEYDYNQKGLLVMTTEKRWDPNGTAETPLRTKYEYTTPRSPAIPYLAFEPGSETDFYNGEWLKRITYAEGTPDAQVVEIIEHDEYGNPTQIKDGEGRITTFVYDQLDRLTKQTLQDPDESTGLQKTPVTEYKYFPSSRLERMTETSVESPTEFITTEYFYDARQRLQHVVGDSSDGPVYTSYEYDDAGNLTAVVDDNDLSGVQRRTEFEYDVLDRLVQVVEPDKVVPGDATGPVTIFAYNALGLLVSSRNSQGNVTSFEYDKLQRLTKVLRPQGGTNQVAGGQVSYTYDAAGQVISEKDASGRQTTYEYDDAGRLTKIFEPKLTGASTNAPITFEYDSLSNLRRVTDQLGHSTQYVYDDLSRLEAEIDAIGKTTAYAYNGANQLEKLTDPESNETTWLYDDAGRIMSETNELGHTRTFTYDAFNRLDKVIDRNGRKVEYDYDNFHRLTEELWYDSDSSTTVVETIEYDYNNLGELIGATAYDGTDAVPSYVDYEYMYNGLGQQEHAIYNFAGLDDEITIDREFTGHLLSETRARLGSSGGTGGTTDFVNTYQYDALERLVQITQDDDGGNDVAEKQVDFRYDADGRMTSTTYLDPSSSVVANIGYAYDERGRIHLLSNSHADYTYQYDDANRLIRNYRVTGAGSQITDYTYDDRNQITGVNYVADFHTDESYVYDDNGNRDSAINDLHNGANQNYQYDETEPNLHNNKFFTDGTYRYLYDAEGNRTVRFVDNGNSVFGSGDTQITRYTWDHRNRLVQVVFQDNFTGATSKSVDYLYDPFNQLIKRTVDPDGNVGLDPIDQAFYLYDQGQVVLEFNKTDSAEVDATDLKHRYLWGPAVDQLLADEQVSNLSSSGQTYWMLSDNLGSIRDVVDSNGNLRIHRDFDSFGNIIGEQHFDEAGFSVLDPEDPDYIKEAFAFTGRFFDEETGLQNNLNRWYDPTTGRWISEDPIGFLAGDANLVRYVGNEPTGYIDPMGLYPPSGLNNNSMTGSWGYGGDSNEGWYERRKKLTDADKLLQNDFMKELEERHASWPQEPWMQGDDRDPNSSFHSDRSPKVSDEQKLKLKRLAELKKLGMQSRHSRLSNAQIRRLNVLYNLFQDPHNPDTLNPLKRIWNFPSDADFRRYIADKQYEVWRNPDAFHYQLDFHDLNDALSAFGGLPAVDGRPSSPQSVHQYNYHP